MIDWLASRIDRHGMARVVVLSVLAALGAGVAVGGVLTVTVHRSAVGGAMAMFVAAGLMAVGSRLRRPAGEPEPGYDEAALRDYLTAALDDETLNCVVTQWEREYR
jgi:hypothetical protein